MPAIVIKAMIVDSNLKPVSDCKVRCGLKQGNRFSYSVPQSVTSGKLELSIDGFDPGVVAILQIAVGKAYRALTLQKILEHSQDGDFGTIICLLNPMVINGENMQGIELNRVRDLLVDFETTKTDLTNQMGSITKQMQVLENEKQTLNDQTRKLNLSLEKAKNDCQILDNDLTRLKASLTTAEQEKIDLANEKNALLLENKKLKADLEEWKTKISGAAAQLNKMNLTNLSTELGHQLALSKKKLAEGQSGYAINHLEFELKGYAMNDGEELAFGIPGSGELDKLPFGLVSTLRFEFGETKGTAEVETVKHAVPNVIGTTDLMAVRILERAGFFAEVHYAAVTDRKQNGRVQSQSAAPGVFTEVGSRIAIYVGKLIE